MTAGDQPGDRAAVILAGLGGTHLREWLPGGDHRAARSSVVASQGGWGGAGGWGQVTPKGIEYRPRDGAELLVTWREVAETVAAGCGDGRREAYQAAYARFGAWARAQPTVAEAARLDAARSDHERADARRRAADEYRQVTEGVRRTTTAIVVAGAQLTAEREADELTLF